MYFEVAWQVKEVVSVLEVVIYFLRQVLDGVLVRDVSDHDSSAGVITDLIEPDLEDIAAILFDLVTCVLDIEVHGVVIDRLLVIHRTGITFLN